MSDMRARLRRLIESQYQHRLAELDAQRQTLVARHEAALRALDDAPVDLAPPWLKDVLAGLDDPVLSDPSTTNGQAGQSARTPVPLPASKPTKRRCILSLLSDGAWWTARQLVAKSKLSIKQVRGVLNDQDVRDLVESRAADDHKEYRLKQPGGVEK